MKEKIVVDSHHLIYPRRVHSSLDQSRQLRNMYLYPMFRDEHEELHDDIPMVPLLSHYALNNVLNDVNPTGNPLRDIDELTRAVEQSVRTPKAHSIERELGKLVAHSLQLQRNYFSV